MTSLVAGCIWGKKGNENNVHLSVFFLPMAFYTGYIKQNTNVISLWSGRYLSLTCCRRRRGRMFYCTELCVTPLWRPLVLAFHWEEKGLSCTLWHLWHAHIAASKWQKKQSMLLLASVISFHLYLCSHFTGTTRVNNVICSRPINGGEQVNMMHLSQAMLHLKKILSEFWVEALIFRINSFQDLSFGKWSCCK